MQTQNGLAMCLMGFGLVGLVWSQLLPSPVNATARELSQTIAVAITSGPQLRLVHTHEPRAALIRSGQHHMICNSVYRLSVADVGFSCRHILNARTLASVAL